MCFKCNAAVAANFALMLRAAKAGEASTETQAESLRSFVESVHHVARVMEQLHLEYQTEDDGYTDAFFKLFEDTPTDEISRTLDLLASATALFEDANRLCVGTISARAKRGDPEAIEWFSTHTNDLVRPDRHEPPPPPAPAPSVARLMSRHPKGIVDLQRLSEDDRIRQIGETVTQDLASVAVLVDDVPGKADRYVRKLAERYPAVEVREIVKGAPVKGVTTIKVGPRKQ